MYPQLTRCALRSKRCQKSKKFILRSRLIASKFFTCAFIVRTNKHIPTRRAFSRIFIVTNSFAIVIESVYKNILHKPFNKENIYENNTKLSQIYYKNFADFPTIVTIMNVGDRHGLNHYYSGVRSPGLHKQHTEISDKSSCSTFYTNNYIFRGHCQLVKCVQGVVTRRGSCLHCGGT